MQLVFLDFLIQKRKNMATWAMKRPPASFPRSFVLVYCRVLMFAHLPTSKSKPGWPETAQAPARPWRITSAGKQGHCPPPPRGSPVLPFLLRGTCQTCCRLLVLVEGSASLMPHGGGWWFGPTQTIPPTCPNRSVWFLQTENLGTSESPRHSEVGWKMWGVVREFQRSEEDALFILKEPPPPTSKFLGGPNTSKVIGALLGLLSEPGGEPEERHQLSESTEYPKVLL